MSSYKETQSIFGPTKRKLALTDHNVGELLTDLKEEERAKVNNHYGARSGANDYNAEKLGGVVNETSERLNNHASYLANIYNKDFQMYTPQEVERITAESGETPLVVPYFNGISVAEKFPQAEIWGFPSELVEPLKNKASFHELVSSAGIEGFEVPEYHIAQKDEYDQKAFGLLQKRKQLYDTHGLTQQYPLGLVVRLEESDGGYGGVYLNQEKEGIHVTYDGDYNSEKKKFVELKHDSGYAWDKAWKKAIAKSREMIYEKAIGDSARVVITPMLDIEDSPGMSMLFMDGQCHSLGWNGQLQINRSKATKGTSSYQPKNDYMKTMQQKYEALSAELAVTYIEQVAADKNIPLEQVRGIIGLDFMIPGPIDAKLRKAEGKKPVLWLAECNPRWTNYTDAVMAVIGASGREPTVSNMLTVINGGIYAEDSVALHGADYEIVRDIVQSHDSRSKKNRTIVRLPDDPMGAIYMGNWKKARKELKNAIGEAKKLQKATTKETILINNSRTDK